MRDTLPLIPLFSSKGAGLAPRDLWVCCMYCHLGRPGIVQTCSQALGNLLIVIFSISSLLTERRWPPWRVTEILYWWGWGEPSLLTVASFELYSLMFWEMLNRRPKNQVPKVTCLGIAELSRDYFMVGFLRTFNKTRCIVISERWCFPNLPDHRPFEETSINIPLKTFWKVMVERHIFSFFQTHVFQSCVFQNEF